MRLSGDMSRVISIHKTRRMGSFSETFMGASVPDEIDADLPDELRRLLRGAG
jgi:hypothetical protein